MVNRGPRGFGFIVCPLCRGSEAAVKPLSIKWSQHKDPMSGRACAYSRPIHPIDLVHRFDTDVLIIRVSRPLPPCSPDFDSLSEFRENCARTLAEAMRFANQEMNDFWVIKKPDGNKMYSAEDSANRHAASVRWLTRRLARHDPARTIVVTHHAPSPWSISPKNALDMLNAAFASDLNPLIKASRIPLWIHGHTHYNVDYKIGTTRIYSNQRGYTVPMGSPSSLPT